MQFVFIVCQVEGHRDILKLSCKHLLFLPHMKFFKKIKGGLELVSHALFFCIIFEGNYFSCYILVIDQVSLSGCLYFVRYWAICALQLFVNHALAS